MAFFQDPSRQPFLRVPVSVLWLIVLLIGLHAGRVLLFPGSESDGIFATYGFVPARYYAGYNPGTLVSRLLPFVTYLFLHGSWSHVLINSVWLLAFGPVVARRFGPVLFLLLFLICGIAAALTHLAAYRESIAPLIGASGAISGLMAASFRMLALGPEEEPALAPLFSARILTWTVIWAAINVFAGITGFGAGPGPAVIAWGAHLGGYAAGLVLAGPFERLARS